jgi:hypothetical protein
MLITDLFRERAIEFQLQKVLDDVTPLEYLIKAFGDTPEAQLLAKELAALCGRVPRNQADRDSDRPWHRFINLVHREDNVSRWADFVRHEQKRAESVWKSDTLRALPEQLEQWYASLNRGVERDDVVRRVAEALQNVIPDLKPEERERIGLRAFRKMLWRLPRR